MTEAQRVAVIAISGTSGGNGSAVILDVAAGAVKDIAGQLIETTNAFAVEEHADVKPPNITGASLHYGRGVLTVTSDEYVDLTPISLVNTSLLRLSNISGDYTVALPYAGASTDSIEELYSSSKQGDGYVFNVTLTEAQRAIAIANSATPETVQPGHAQ